MRASVTIIAMLVFCIVIPTQRRDLLLHNHFGADFLNYEANTKDFSFAVCFAPLRSLREMYYHDCLDTYVDVISMLPVFLGSSFFAIFISLVFFCTAIAAKMLSVNDMA